MSNEQQAPWRNPIRPGRHMAGVTNPEVCNPGDVISINNYVFELVEREVVENRPAWKAKWDRPAWKVKWVHAGRDTASLVGLFEWIFDDDPHWKDGSVHIEATGDEMKSWRSTLMNVNPVLAVEEISTTKSPQAAWRNPIRSVPVKTTGFTPSLGFSPGDIISIKYNIKPTYVLKLLERTSDAWKVKWLDGLFRDDAPGWFYDTSDHWSDGSVHLEATAAEMREWKVALNKQYGKVGEPAVAAVAETETSTTKNPHRFDRYFQLGLSCRNCGRRDHTALGGAGISMECQSELDSFMKSWETDVRTSMASDDAKYLDLTNPLPSTITEGQREAAAEMRRKLGGLIGGPVFVAFGPTCCSFCDGRGFPSPVCCPKCGRSREVTREIKRC